MTNAPFIIYGDFESVLIPSTNIVDFVPKTKKYQDHIVCSYDYKVICTDERYSKPYKIYFDKLDVIDKILNDRTKESDCCSKIIETAFNQSFVITKKRP